MCARREDRGVPLEVCELVSKRTRTVQRWQTSGMAVLVLLLAVVVALLGVLVAGLLRSHAEILRALHEMGVGLDPDQVPAPAMGVEVPRSRREIHAATDLAGVTPRGDSISVSLVGVEHSTLVAFLTSGCSTCSGFWSAFGDLPSLGVPGQARLVVVTKGTEAESPGVLAKFAPPDAPVVMSSAAWDDFDVPVAPYFAFVDGPSGAIVGEGAAGTWDHLRSMLEQALADAGIEARGPRRARGRKSREARVDAELFGAGLEPNDPSLYPNDASDLGVRPDARHGG